MLKVCVRRKADDCIKRKGWFHSFDSVGVVEKNSLESQNEITYKYHDSIGPVSYTHLQVGEGEIQVKTCSPV